MTRKKQEPAPAPVAAPQPRRVLVVYVHDHGDDGEKHVRIWIDGLADLRTLEEVLKTESLIAQQQGHKNVRIINWHALEG